MGILQRRRQAEAKPAVVDSFYTDVLAALPAITVWAVAANGEFRAKARAEGDAPIRGVLHHDGALLHFTTWGLVERFARSPMEFDWATESDELSVRGVQPATFSDFAPLSTLVSEPPVFAAPIMLGSNDPFFGLEEWLQSWS